VLILLEINTLNIKKSDLFLKKKKINTKKLSYSEISQKMKINNLNSPHDKIDINTPFSKKSDDSNKNFINKPVEKDITLFVNIPKTTPINRFVGNFTIVSLFDSEYEIFNRVTKQFNYFNLSSPFDEFQIVEEIECTNDNCAFPNLCLNDNICACDNHFANYNYSDTRYCSYPRKSPVVVSILEIMTPGAGFLYAGTIKYGIFKFIFGIILFILLILNVLKKKNELEYLEENNFIPKNDITMETSSENRSNSNKKDTNSMFEIHKKITYDRNIDKTNAQKSLLFYFMIIIGLAMLIWLFIDFVLIGMRVKTDGNGVGFTIYSNFGNSY